MECERATAADVATGGPDARPFATEADSPTQEPTPGSPAAVAGVVAPDVIRCAHCGAPIPLEGRRRGRPSRFCRPAHREAARLRREQGLDENAPKARPGGRRRLAVRRPARRFRTSPTNSGPRSIVCSTRRPTASCSSARRSPSAWSGWMQRSSMRAPRVRCSSSCAAGTSRAWPRRSPSCGPATGPRWSLGGSSGVPMPDSARERYRRAALRLPDHRRGGRRTGRCADPVRAAGRTPPHGRARGRAPRSLLMAPCSAGVC
jgi:hypothetical protein